MHQHKIAVFDLSREHAELRLDVRARIVVCNVIRLDPERAGRAAEAAAADFVIRCCPLDIEQSASLPQNLQEFLAFFTCEAFHHGISFVYNSLLQKLLVLHELF